MSIMTVPDFLYKLFLQNEMDKGRSYEEAKQLVDAAFRPFESCLDQEAVEIFDDPKLVDNWPNRKCK